MAYNGYIGYMIYDGYNIIYLNPLFMNGYPLVI